MDYDEYNAFCRSLPATAYVVQWGGAHVWKVGGKVFAIGGMLDGGYTSTVEAYDPEEDNWAEMDSMSQARCNPGEEVINLNGKFNFP